jgi:hypothetical protein
VAYGWASGAASEAASLHDPITVWISVDYRGDRRPDPVPIDNHRLTFAMLSPQIKRCALVGDYRPVRYY